VQIVSSQPIVLIGPGSEWLWSAISGLALIVTFVAIWRQLRAERDMSAFEQLTRLEEGWMDETLTRAKLRVARATQKEEAAPWGAALAVGAFCERIASLAHAGHISARAMWESNGLEFLLWWVLLEPEVRRFREEEGQHNALEHFEWLATQLARLSAQARIQSLDSAAVSRSLARYIEAYEERLSMLEQSRAVPVVTPNTARVLGNPEAGTA